MKILNWGIVLLLLLLAVIATVSIVSAKEDANEYEPVEVDSVGVIDVNSIKLPPLHFDNSQEKVIVNGELNPSEEKKTFIDISNSI